MAGPQPYNGSPLLKESGHSGNSYQKKLFLKFASYLKIFKKLRHVKNLGMPRSYNFFKDFLDFQKFGESDCGWPFNFINFSTNSN